MVVNYCFLVEKIIVKYLKMYVKLNVLVVILRALCHQVDTKLPQELLNVLPSSLVQTLMDSINLSCSLC